MISSVTPALVFLLAAFQRGPNIFLSMLLTHWLYISSFNMDGETHRILNYDSYMLLSFLADEAQVNSLLVDKINQETTWSKLSQQCIVSCGV